MSVDGQATTVALRYAREQTQPVLPDRVDWSRAPRIYRRRADLPTTALPWSVSRAASPGSGAILARVLRASYAVARQRWSAPGGMGRKLDPAGTRTPSYLPGRAFRPVPSGGARYPCDLYVLADENDSDAGLATGAYHYDPAHHSLTLLPGTDPDTSGTAVVLTADLGSNVFKYGDFGYRLHCMDAGVLLGQLVAVCQAEGLAPWVRFYFPERELDRRLGLDPATSSAYAVVDLDRSSALPAGTCPPVRRSAPAAAGTPAPSGQREARPWTERTRTMVSWPTSLPGLVHEAAQAGEGERTPCTATEAAWLESLVPGGEGITLPPGQFDLAQGFRERHSCLGYFDGSRPSADQLAAVLRFAMGALDSDATNEAASPARILLMCAVVGVEGIEAGVYRYDPRLHRLHPVRRGPLGTELDESLLFRIFDMRRAAFCLFPVSEYDRGLAAHGARWYRVQNMMAGLVTQRAYLAAGGAGLGCHAHCGYQARKVTSLLGLEGTGLTPMIEIIVGGESNHGTYYECRI